MQSADNNGSCKRNVSYVPSVDVGSCGSEMH